jgi:methyltransferase-like protein 6
VIQYFNPKCYSAMEQSSSPIKEVGFLDANPAVSFFHEDFTFEEIQRETENMKLPEITQHRDTLEYCNDWDKFFHCHSKGSFFKSRRYIVKEFEAYIDSSCSIVEVGCGHGCTMVPILKSFPEISYIATDFSPQALTIIRNNISDLLSVPSLPDTVQLEVLDIVTSPLITDCDPLPSIALCIFAISAIDPVFHAAAFRNVYLSLAPGGCMLFRDYAIHDMTMYRHKVRFGENLYQRGDGTLAYYFDLDYLDALLSSVGFSKVELRYDTVQCRNKRSSVDMKRVFVHAVYCRKIADELL